MCAKDSVVTTDEALGLRECPTILVVWLGGIKLELLVARLDVLLLL